MGFYTKYALANIACACEKTWDESEELYTENRKEIEAIEAILAEEGITSGYIVVSQGERIYRHDINAIASQACPLDLLPSILEAPSEPADPRPHYMKKSGHYSNSRSMHLSDLTIPDDHRFNIRYKRRQQSKAQRMARRLNRR